MTSKSKNDLFYLILFILTLITMVCGITFTYFSLVSSEREGNTRIKTGTLAIDYIDGNDFSEYGLIPITEPNLNSTYGVYKKNFAVSSKGTLDQTLDIYIKVTENQFANNALKYALYDSNGSKIGKGSIPSEGNILATSGVYLMNNTSKNFTILIWLEKSDSNQDSDQEKAFIGGIDVTATQLKY